MEGGKSRQDYHGAAWMGTLAGWLETL